MKVRKAHERGRTRLDWLESWHSFSFADFHDPEWVQIGPLRVINDDIIAAGGGFGTHPHRDMEIITYVLEGQIEHKDSMGTGSVIHAGEVQHMSAGTGVTHSEFNPSNSHETRLLQIWIHPDRSGYAPGYQQIDVSADEKRGRLRVIASPDGREGSVTINQDATVSALLLDGEESVSSGVGPGRLGWIQVARGSLEVNGRPLSEGDGLAVGGGEVLGFGNGKDAEVLVFDLPSQRRT